LLMALRFLAVIASLLGVTNCDGPYAYSTPGATACDFAGRAVTGSGSTP